MSNEDEKLDLDDIKDPLDELDEPEEGEGLDTPEAQEENPKASNEHPQVKEKKVKEKRKLFGSRKEKRQKAEKVKEKTEKNTEKNDVEGGQNYKKKGSSLKTFAVVILTMLVTSALVLGGVYYWLNKDGGVTKTETTLPVEEPKKEELKKESKSVFVNAEAGLNLRKEPSKTAEILAIIPHGTKLTVLEEQGDWYKTEYQSKTGWVMKEFTSAENPLVYKNTKYGFEITFPAGWGGYKFFPMAPPGSGATMVLYLTLPTTDKDWIELNIDGGYASMFAISVYTPAQWATAKNEEHAPTYLTENGTYVFAWSQGQAAPTDLSSKYQEIKKVIETFDAK